MPNIIIGKDGVFQNGFFGTDLPTNGLLAYYPLDGNSNDDSSNGLDGTDNNMSYVNDPTYGTVAEFDDANVSYIELPNGFADFTGGLTITSWVNFQTQKDFERIVDLGNGSGIDIVTFNTGGPVEGTDTMLFEIWNNGNEDLKIPSDSGMVDFNQWNFYAARLDTLSNELTYFKNGSPYGSKISTSVVPDNVTRSNNWIGRNNFNLSETSDALKREIRIYNVPLSDSEILSIYNNS